MPLLILARWRFLRNWRYPLYVILVFNIFFVTIVISNINPNFWSCSWASWELLAAILNESADFRGKRQTKNYHELSYTWSNEINYRRVSWRIWTSSKWMIVDESRWYCMIVSSQTEENASTILHYRQLSSTNMGRLTRTYWQRSWLLRKEPDHTSFALNPELLN